MGTTVTGERERGGRKGERERERGREREGGRERERERERGREGGQTKRRIQYFAMVTISTWKCISKVKIPNLFPHSKY